MFTELVKRMLKKSAAPDWFCRDRELKVPESEIRQKIRQDICDILAREKGNGPFGADNRHPGNRVRNDLELEMPSLLRCKHNPAGFDRSIQAITRLETEPVADLPRKDDLTLRRYTRFHGKTILPPSEHVGKCD